MDTMLEMISLTLAVYSDGLSAKDIANKWGYDKRTVNSVLYAHPERFTFTRDTAVPIWTNVPDAVETDPVLLKLQNRENARKFSQADFDSIANWEHGFAFSGNHTYTTKTGNEIECDSKSEVLLLQYLEENRLVKDLGGQMLKIVYDTEFRRGNSYYPDVVALTHDNRIAVFEVKPVTAMSYHRNIEKYRALAKYCEKHGYLYTMIDPAHDFMTFEELRDMEICFDLDDIFESLEEKAEAAQDTDTPYYYFDKDTVNEWYDIFDLQGDGYTKQEFYLQVHACIIRFGWYNSYTHGFMAYSRPVKFNKDHEVIDYV